MTGAPQRYSWPVQRIAAMIVLVSTVGTTSAFSPARCFLQHVHRNFGGRASRCTTLLNQQGRNFEEYSTKRSTFEPAEPRVGPTAVQSSGRVKVWPNYYCAPDLDRQGRALNPEDFSAALQSPESRFILVWQGKNIFQPMDDGTYDAVFLSHVEASPFTSDPQSVVTSLGKHKGMNFFGLDISQIKDEPSVNGRAGLIFEQLRSFGGLLRDDHDAGLLASARGMAVWHRTTSFCSKCGSGDMKPAKMGTSRKCGSCGARQFPRTDPSIIVAVASADDQHLLLGRKDVWPKGRYSTLAGFSEMGESLEECVLREVLEESGVHVNRDSLRFTSSQPWPFPRSLMIGFHAAARETPDGSLPPIQIQQDEREKIQEDEMEDVAWFSREQVRAAINGESGLNIPGRASLAFSLIKTWAEGVT